MVAGGVNRAVVTPGVPAPKDITNPSGLCRVIAVEPYSSEPSVTTIIYLVPGPNI